jgi:K+:H+ antiporter
MATMAFVAIAAVAADPQKGAGAGSVGGPGEAILIAQIALLLLVGRGLGEIMQRFGQPTVVGQLLAGLILGPSLFGWLLPHIHAFLFPNTPEQRSLLSGISEVGVLLLLLITGMETDIRLVRKVGVAALAVTATGVIVPFVCGFMLGQVLPQSVLPDAQHRLVASLFLGTALSISSIKIVAVVVREMNFLRRNLGQIIVASAIMEDTIGWIIVSITLGLAGSGVAVGSVAATIAGTLLFLIVSYAVGRPLVFRLIRWVNDTFVSEYAVVTAIMIVMCVMATITQAIGVNAVLGAFVAGVLVGESPILSQQIDDEIRGFITAFMMPIFFGLSGLSANLTILANPQLALLAIVIILIASVGKFGGAFVGGLVSKLSHAESLALGCAMNARGSTDVIVATIGLSAGALTQNLYTMIVMMAVVTTMVMPPALRWALGRLPMNRDERKRLQAEEIDAKGFVSDLERLLIVIDESANGKFAARVSDFIASQRGTPTTVLQLNGKEKPDSAVSKEAHKGYDALFLGLSDMNEPDGTFSATVDRAIGQFDGPFVLVRAGKPATVLTREALNILVPVDGTESSRKGADLALAMSPPSATRVTALHVAERAAPEKRPKRRLGVRKGPERAMLDDVVKLAKRHGHDRIETAVHTMSAPDAAILEEAREVDADVIVVGTSRRVGEQLYLGQTVSRIVQRWKGALVIVVS